jgi:hypothetical protein
MTAFISIAGSIILLLLSPAIMGLVDIWCWTMLGHTVSGTNWIDGRVVASFIMAALAGLVVIAVCGIISGVERGVDLHVR